MASLHTLNYESEPIPGPERAPTFIDSVSVDLFQNARILHELERPIYSTWDLEPYTGDQLPERSRPFLSSSSGIERVVNDPDERKKVKPEDYGPDGKYRAICKLFLQFRGFEYKATGWLIDDSTLVTAGHNVYDWRDGYLISAKAYIGYYGPDSERDSNIQHRNGRSVILPYAWIAKAYENYDVALIALEKPFKISGSLKYTDTPETATNVSLGVVGYPMDLNNGNFMYECFVDTKYDLSRRGMMLAYKIDTEGGNSGSPVLRRDSDDDLIAIGVHCYGGNALNRGSIFGPYGNSISNLRNCLRDRLTGTLQQIPRTSEIARVPGFGIIEMSAPGPNEPIPGFHDITAYPMDLNFAEKDRRPGDIVSVDESRVDDNSTHTVFFINIPSSGKTQEETDTIAALQKNVTEFQGWAYKLAANFRDQHVNSRTVSGDTRVTEGTCHAQAIDWIFKNKAPWLNQHEGFPENAEVVAKGAGFCREVLAPALSVPFESIEYFSRPIELAIRDANKSQKVQFWLMVTKYGGLGVDGICATVKTLSFCTVGPRIKGLIKDRYLFRVDEYDFNGEMWKQYKTVIPKEVIDKGEHDINKLGMSIDIPLVTH